MHPSTFQYHQPTKDQAETMMQAREAATVYAQALDGLIPDGPDKDHVMRLLRTVAMWVNVALTRQPDGTPR